MMTERIAFWNRSHWCRLNLASMVTILGCTALSAAGHAANYSRSDAPGANGYGQPRSYQAAERSGLDSVRKKIEALQRELRKQGERFAAQELALVQQSQTIATQRRMLEDQAQALRTLQAQVLAQEALAENRGTGAPQPAPKEPRAQPDQTQPERRPVGQAPVQISTRPPEIANIADIGGVLTPKGRLMIEPALLYSHSSVNRFSFLGVEILETFLIGFIQAEDVDRDLFSPQITGRYGVTDRLELEVKVPYIFRDDRFDITIPQVQQEEVAFSRQVDGSGIGDVEIGLHYQLNDGSDSWPFFVGNLRYKTDTGDGPFDVSRDARGNEAKLATGSGFQSVEPSVTMLFPSDPAVFFANLGYLFNLGKDVNQTFGDAALDTAQSIGAVDPGDTLRVSFGMGYSLNERASFTLGYKEDFIAETDTEINGVSFSARSLNVGSLLLGWAYLLNSRVTTDLNLELGMTKDAPDVQLTLRVPIVAHQF